VTDDRVMIKSMFDRVEMRVGMMSGSWVRGSLNGESESGTVGRNGQIDVLAQCEGRRVRARVRGWTMRMIAMLVRKGNLGKSSERTGKALEGGKGKCWWRRGSTIMIVSQAESSP
jgi:hypothetical protein